MAVGSARGVGGIGSVGSVGGLFFIAAFGLSRRLSRLACFLTLLHQALYDLGLLALGICAQRLELVADLCDLQVGYLSAFGEAR